MFRKCDVQINFFYFVLFVSRNDRQKFYLGWEFSTESYKSEDSCTFLYLLQVGRCETLKLWKSSITYDTDVAHRTKKTSHKTSHIGIIRHIKGA